MLPNYSWGVIGSLIFYIAVKFLCLVYNLAQVSMNNKKHQVQLCSIPEINEPEEEVILTHGKKFVPKNKHDVLKAKYKCLKKLFQVYDASLIGILPADDNSYEQGDHYGIPKEPSKQARQITSCRAKIDASAGTNDHGGIKLCDKGCSVASPPEAPRKRSCSTQVMTELAQKSGREMKSSDHPNLDDIRVNGNCNSQMQHQKRNLVLPHSRIHQDTPRTRKLTRFQSFIQRLCGLRRKNYVNPVTRHIYAVSDNNIVHQYKTKQRNTGLRYRRLRRSKSHSESQLRDLSSPAIMQYVQSVQKHYLRDRTPRNCPISKCNRIFYGIINYNDHLNLCHFIENKYVCHYCHEGFQVEYDKYTHENGHLGVTELKNNIPTHENEHLGNTELKNNMSTKESKLLGITELIDNMPTNKSKHLGNTELKNNIPTHENEHLGLNKQNNKKPVSSKEVKTQTKKTTKTQTDPINIPCCPEGEIQKIVSFLENIVNTKQRCTEMYNSSFSEPNLRNSNHDTNAGSGSETTYEKRAISPVNFLSRKSKKLDLTESIISGIGSKSPSSIEVSLSKCLFCGEEFDNKRQLKRHIDLGHGLCDKVRRLHRCGSNYSDCQRMYRSDTMKQKYQQLKLKTGQIDIRSKLLNASSTSPDAISEVTRDKSGSSLQYDPSTNIIYSESIDSVKEQSIPHKPTRVTNYRWEPGTKIIRV